MRGLISRSISLPGGLVVSIEETIPVSVDPHRDLHGPSVVRADNGDLLLSHQDSEKHRGGDGYVHQWRSVDGGFSWQDEGPAADWRSRGMDALFGEYARAPDGRLVMFVQRRQPLGGDLAIGACWYSLSDDHGRTWEEQGPVDGSDEHAVMYVRSVQTRDGVMYGGMWSRHGSALYASEDNGISWQKRSVIFPSTHPGFERLRQAGPPFYPHAVICPDGTMLAMTYMTPPTHHCYSRRSSDLGATWGEIREETHLDVWAPRMNRLSRELMIITGRDIDEKATVALFSTDDGRTWGERLIVDRPQQAGSYAYTDTISLDDSRFWTFTSSPRSEGRGDIIGVLCSIRR